MKLTFHAILTILFFSLWAGFALLVVNPLYKDDLPGYTIGRLCIWELVAIIIAGLLAFSVIKKWGYPEIQKTKNKDLLVLNSKYAYFFLAYLLLAIVVAIWQFWLFSLKF